MSVLPRACRPCACCEGPPRGPYPGYLSRSICPAGQGLWWRRITSLSGLLYPVRLGLSSVTKLLTFDAKVPGVVSWEGEIASALLLWARSLRLTRLASPYKLNL